MLMFLVNAVEVTNSNGSKYNVELMCSVMSLLFGNGIVSRKILVLNVKGKGIAKDGFQ